jgi:hypothetical protein
MIYFIVDKEQEKEISGVSFDGITKNWTSTYKVKMRADKECEVMSFCQYETKKDPANLRYYLHSRIIVRDLDFPGELTEKTILETNKISFTKWKSQGHKLGKFLAGKVYEVEIIFSTNEMPRIAIGQSGAFDFEFGIIE